MDLDDQVKEKKQKKKFRFPLLTYISTGRKYAKLGLYDKAVATYKAALEDYPDNVQLLVDRASLLLRLGKTSEARKDIEASLQLNPKNREAIALRGEVNYLMGDFERGYVTFHEAYVNHPKLDSPRLGMMEKCKFAMNNALDPQTVHIDPVKDVDDLLLTDQERKMKMRRVNKCSKRFRDDIRFIELVLSDNCMKPVHTQCKDLLGYLKDRDELSRMEDTNRRREMLKNFSVDSLERTTESSERSPTEGSSSTTESFSTDCSLSSVCEAAIETKDEWTSPIGSSSGSDFSLRLTCRGMYLNRFRFKYREGEPSSAQEDSEPVQGPSGENLGEEREEKFRHVARGAEKEPADELSCGDSIYVDNILSYSRFSNGFKQHESKNRD